MVFQPPVVTSYSSPQDQMVQNARDRLLKFRSERATHEERELSERRGLVHASESPVGCPGTPVEAWYSPQPTPYTATPELGDNTPDRSAHSWRASEGTPRTPGGGKHEMATSQNWRDKFPVTGHGPVQERLQWERERNERLMEETKQAARSRVESVEHAAKERVEALMIAQKHALQELKDELNSEHAEQMVCEQMRAAEAVESERKRAAFEFETRLALLLEQETEKREVAVAAQQECDMGEVTRMHNEMDEMQRVQREEAEERLNKAIDEAAAAAEESEHMMLLACNEQHESEMAQVKAEHAALVAELMAEHKKGMELLVGAHREELQVSSSETLAMEQEHMAHTNVMQVELEELREALNAEMQRTQQLVLRTAELLSLIHISEPTRPY
eukprot:TRINITY_DN5502_c0_g1_i2.p1 TRINITY_DN5502_c0_g1~~TRINITY_DN5502_c0_g1_i2.p1  ORF type:complete len:389 (-),score=144.81 TRINITY_DN5502_c0_g1_i2:147-1313(-)